MKTSIRTIILAVATILAAMSCQKEASSPETQGNVKTGETIQVNINASLGYLDSTDGTKATAKPVIRLEWDGTETVDAYCGTTKLNTNSITVTPSENGLFAKLNGTITAPEVGQIITFVYSSGCTADGLTFNFSSQDANIPFVAYATLIYDGTALTDKMVEFKFATSVMKIAATNLGGGTISNATISGINTEVTLTPDAGSETCGIAGSEKASITKTAGIDASSDGTRAIVTVGLVPDNNTGRNITVTQTDFTNKGVITSAEIKSSTSYTTPASLFTCGSLNGHDYVSIAGTKWATQNLAITESGYKAWKGNNPSDAVTVPGTNEGVIVGDYFQWAAYAGYCGQDTDDDKGLLIYTSFINTKCVGVTGTVSYVLKSAGGSDKYRFNTSNKTGYKGITPYYESGNFTNYKDKGAGLAETDDAARILWQGTWRMPTTAEFKAMREATYWAWDGTDCGYYVFMPGLGTSGAAGGRANINTPDDKTKALLFFPAAGCGSNASISDAGANGRYCSSTLYSSSDAYYLSFSNSSVNPQGNLSRYYGFSVRPVSD